MPEGDTVWRTARQLDEALTRRRLAVSDLRVPALATTDLRGRTVEGTVSVGKHLLTRLTGRPGDAVEGGLTLHTHLRMDGAWRVQAAGEPWRGGPASSLRVVLGDADVVALGYRLPVVELVATRREAVVVGHLGPDLCGPGWDAAEAVRRLREQPDRAVGEALLDQTRLAGIGTLYRAEVLFLRGVSPWTPVRGVEDLPGLVDLAHRLLRANLDRATQVTTGVDRRGRRTWVFQRERQPCRRCGRPVRAARQGAPPRDRPTYWCPTCQPPPPSVPA